MNLVIYIFVIKNVKKKKSIMNYDLIGHVVLKWLFQTLAAILAYYFSFLLAYGVSFPYFSAGVD